MKGITLGIEIECILNTQLHQVSTGSHGSPASINGLKSWRCKHDGSLDDRNAFKGHSQCCELVTKRLKSVTSFRDALKEFEAFFSKKGIHELHEVLVFNSSCGAHVHFSVTGFRFEKKCLMYVYELQRKQFAEKILQSSIASRENIVKHYSRRYSMLLTQYRWRYPSKYHEFNFLSERSNRGLEWRAPNMLGILTWKEFWEYWDIILDCLEFLYNLGRNYSYELHCAVATKRLKAEMQPKCEQELVAIPALNNTSTSENIAECAIASFKDEEVLCATST